MGRESYRVVVLPADAVESLREREIEFLQILGCKEKLASNAAEGLLENSLPAQHYLFISGAGITLME